MEATLDEKFVGTVRSPIESFWQGCTLKKAAEAEHFFDVPNVDAIGYCLDHNHFSSLSPEAKRLIHRVIDIYGRHAVCDYLADRIKLVKQKTH